MKLSRSRLISVIAAAYVLVVVGGMLLHFLETGELGTLKYSLMLPATLSVILIGSLVAFGLWRGFAWAWWLGLVAVAFQLIRFGEWFVSGITAGTVPLASWIIAFLLLTFFYLLLTKTARQQCSR